ncbi:hypothetical protein [Pseudobacter ginsenosidimutans]|nr:hypothetical protein [Pseudobacter ginsenosidimutans]QEC43070.1 hypothetical protein FSB84_15735 [Pseudobacter ginsenosidimutans]
MKITLLSLLSLVLLIAGCNKNDNNPQTFIQLQRIGSSEEAYAFQYNEDHLPAKIELYKSSDGAPVLDEYFTVSYENGAPVKAEYFNKRNGSFKLSTRYTFTTDTQKRITKALIKRFSSDGTELPETIKRDYVFNNNGKLVKIIFNEDQDNTWVLEYDANGNYKESPYTNDQPTLKHTRTADYKYDNNINPFSVNGLGIMMMVAFDGDVFNADMLLSENNISSSKFVDTRIDYPGTQFQETTIETKSITYANAFDANGGLQKIDFSRNYKEEHQNEVIRDDTYQFSLNLTCIKKNR